MEARKTPALYQKRDGKWYCTLWGRQRYLGKNLEVARGKLKGLLEGKEEEKHVETVGEFAEAYLESLKNNQSEDTIRTKAVTYRSFRGFVGEKTRMGGITAETIERYKQHGFAQRLNRQTVRSRLLNLSALFEHAVKLGAIKTKTNPVRQVPRVKASVDPDPDYLTEDEEAKLLVLTDDQRYPWLRKRDRLIFILMLDAGLRRIAAANALGQIGPEAQDAVPFLIEKTKSQRERMSNGLQIGGSILPDVAAEAIKKIQGE